MAHVFNFGLGFKLKITDGHVLNVITKIKRHKKMNKIKILSVSIVALGYNTNTVAQEQQQSEQAEGYSVAKSLNMYVFPDNEQSKEQQELDEVELLK